MYIEKEKKAVLFNFPFKHDLGLGMSGGSLHWTSTQGEWTPKHQQVLPLLREHEILVLAQDLDKLSGSICK